MQRHDPRPAEALVKGHQLGAEPFGILTGQGRVHQQRACPQRGEQRQIGPAGPGSADHGYHRPAELTLRAKYVRIGTVVAPAHRMVHAVDPVQQRQGESQRHLRDRGRHGLPGLGDVDAPGEHLVGDERPDAGSGVCHQGERLHPVQQLPIQPGETPARDEDLHLAEVVDRGKVLDAQRRGLSQGRRGGAQQLLGGRIEEFPVQRVGHDDEQRRCGHQCWRGHVSHPSRFSAMNFSSHRCG